MKLNMISVLAVVAEFHLAGGEPVAKGSEASSVPLGHPDFYPSPDRPMGWRGDGSGAWPGANCVTKWDAETGENIVWKALPPGAGFSQPQVVGEKVFLTCGANILVCYNAHNGEEFWRVAIDRTKAMEPAMAEKRAPRWPILTT